jgi:DNA-binding MarR family transcriptional regulator
MSIVSQAQRMTNATDPQTLLPEQVIGHLLKNLHLSVRQSVEEALRVQRIDMSLPHFMALLTLESEPGIPGAELARRGFVTAQTMNTILRRLEREGDIQREPHPQRSRADSWYLTKNGQARLKRARVIVEAVWSRILSVLKPAEMKQMQSMLERCIRGMDVEPDGVRTPRAAKTALTATRSAPRRRA